MGGDRTTGCTGRRKAFWASRRIAAGAAGWLVAWAAPAAAQSQWDSVITNSNWYVSVPQMLAYGSSSTSFADPFPVGDQTLWALGTSTNGVFTGTSAAELAVGPITTTSSMSIQGYVSPSGQITMLFTDPNTGLVTVGLGMMREVDGVTTMEMQMITGTTLLVTHWAYMLPYDPATFTPPSAQVVPSNASPQWAWTEGTPWRVISPALFGTSAPGRFVITDYKSGYFWGQGIGPDGARFTLIGSITPEGKVLFSALPSDDPQLTNLYGDVSGTAAGAAMLLGEYDSTGSFTGDFALTTLVQPYALTLRAMGNPAPLGAARVLYGIDGTLAGLFGPLAPALGVLDGLSGPALSAALSQTLPTLAGNAARATYDTQRGLQQIVAGRLATRGPGDDTQVWLQPFGGFGSQSAQSGYAGYSASGGGLVAGVDRAVSADLTLGALFAYSDMSLTGTAIGAPSSLDISSYAVGVYGSYALRPGLALDFALDGAFNTNGASRTLGFMGTTARADYDSTTFHAGAALRQSVALSADLTVEPSLRLDYGRVDAGSYTETGAGALNLAVASQSYQELMLGAGLRGTYRLAAPVSLTSYVGAGYNVLDTGASISAAFLGGGAPFLTPGADLSPWLFTAGAALMGTKVGGLDLKMSYDLQVSPSGLVNQMGALSLRVAL